MRCAAAHLQPACLPACLAHPSCCCFLAHGPPLQVNRLELMLSIASFAAALGAMVAGIFGMNLRR